MSLADGIVLLLVACAAVAVLRFMRSQKKAGKRPAAAEVAPVLLEAAASGKENAKEGA